MNPSVYPLLSGSAALTALIADRLWPVTAPQDTARPYLVWTPVGISTEQYFANPDDVDYDRVSIDCWADDFAAADAMARAARAALSGHGYLVSGFSDYEDDTKLYRVTFDWSFVTTPS